MFEPASSAPRSFAVDVVRTLREAGYEALWAGGCVRDQLLGIVPKDYDVATSARPEQIRDLFGRRRTLAIGASFGVITVLGPREAGAIEVATFRCDGAYLDGRHPAGVTFSTAEEDAQRRDFTINGLFFDPLASRVLDYVGGQDDLQRRVIRAIRDPRERFQEDKLRMLRAVRFAATFDFAIDPATFAAVRQLAAEMVIVSAERIAAELRRMLVHPRRALAVRLLQETGLLEVILPESQSYNADNAQQDGEAATLRWQTTLALLNAAVSPDFPAALALLLRGICHAHVGNESPVQVARKICRRWKLSNEETDAVGWMLAQENGIRGARQEIWPQIQPLLVHPLTRSLLVFADAVENVLSGDGAGVAFCREKLALPPEELDPPPLVTGDDLKRAGMQPGPLFRTILERVRVAQLAGLLSTSEEALQLARHLLDTQQSD